MIFVSDSRRGNYFITDAEIEAQADILIQKYCNDGWKFVIPSEVPSGE